MTQLQVTLVQVPYNLWCAWPEDRSLEELCKDALGMERRILKGVQVKSEELRYTQMCNRIETLVVDLSQRWKLLILAIDGAEAESYLNLVGHLSGYSKDVLRQPTVRLLDRMRYAINAESNFFHKLVQLIKLILGLGGKPIRFDVKNMSTRVLIGKSFFANKNEVSELAALYERLALSDLKALPVQMPDLLNQSLRNLLYKRSRFLQSALENHARIVEIVNF